MKANGKSHQIFIIGVILLALTLVGCSGGGSAPRVAVAPASYDFGQIGPDPVTTVFTVRNEGGGPLQVESVSTSCGCTAAHRETTWKSYNLPRSPEGLPLQT